MIRTADAGRRRLWRRGVVTVARSAAPSAERRHSRALPRAPLPPSSYTASSPASSPASAPRARCLSSTASDVDAAILTAARTPQTSVPLALLLQTGQDIHPHEPNADGMAVPQRVIQQVAMFLRRELPVRLAHRCVDLQGLPALAEMPSVCMVRDWYATSFHEINNAPPPNSVEAEMAFAKLLDNIYERHAPVLTTMARGAYELRQRLSKGDKEHFTEVSDVHRFLDKFYLSRIGIRMLIAQYLELRRPPCDRYVGQIYLDTSPHDVALAAIEDAAFMCERQLGESPKVTIHGRLDLTFPYVPSHLHYILLELFKNSMRATVEKHTDAPSLPPIKVIIADGENNEDVVIKVSDQGGGIPRSNVDRIFSYLFTTADPEVQKGFVEIGSLSTDFDRAAPLSGLGYGLPISRLYARYFGGDLSLMSMESYGVDAYLHLNKLENEDEPLP